jgi:hypothetical protein
MLVDCFTFILGLMKAEIRPLVSPDSFCKNQSLDLVPFLKSLLVSA